MYLGMHRKRADRRSCRPRARLVQTGDKICTKIGLAPFAKGTTRVESGEVKIERHCGLAEGLDKRSDSGMMNDTFSGRPHANESFLFAPGLPDGKI